MFSFLFLCLQSSSSSSQDDEKSTLEEVSEGAIPIDHPPLTLSPTGPQDADLSFPHSQTTLNKSSSSPELQTLPEAFAKAASISAASGSGSASGVGDAPRVRTPVEGKAQAEREAGGQGDSAAVAPAGGGGGGGGGMSGGGGGASVSSSSSAAPRMRLECPTQPQPGPLSPSGHRPRGHTISVSAPSSRRERKMDRDAYPNRPGPSNSEKASGLSPRSETTGGIDQHMMR